MRFPKSLLASVLLATTAHIAWAQSTDGAGSVIVIPLVAQTGSFATEVTVRNLNAAPLTLDVKFYEGLNSGTPGAKTCSQLTLSANETKQFLLEGQCGPLGAGGHFGMVLLQDASTERTR